MYTPFLGPALALLSALSFAFGNNFIMRASRSGGDKGVMFSVLLTMALSFVLWQMSWSETVGDVDGKSYIYGILWFSMAGIFAMLFGRSLIYQSIQLLGVARSSAVKRLNPFFTVLLAALIVKEPITGLDLWGMMVIALGFGLLIRQSLKNSLGTDTSKAPSLSAYGYGVTAALAYAISYISRKMGLIDLGSPAFGTFVSAVAGFACFAIMALFSAQARDNVTKIFSMLDRWIFLSAFFVSLGQILLFSALAYSPVSQVALIASLEIFFSIGLSHFVFRNAEQLSFTLLLAASLAMSGVILVSW